MFSVVVIISGGGSNLRALLTAAASPLYPAKVVAVGSDKAASGLEHAEEFGVPTFVVEPSRFESREAWAEVLLSNIEFHKPDLVVLAGFMKVLPANIVNKLTPRMINLHPSLLPDFPGAHAVADALAAGASVTGATIHIVDEGVDTGRILTQASMAVTPGISEIDLHDQIKLMEREQLVQVVQDIATGVLLLAEKEQSA
ncbi:phosphoribosylglycinamide formyltransferase [Aquiluna sp. Uisw_065]|mgnify:FL=1|jgi:phosphoribosylglycinamide formyltransferase-1|uniref:phosphoribosylglycinamide formyltransferase n=1 Tax=Aquiluna sp. Uisw_065 TaxID=3230967 RepID=UPI0039E7B8B6